MELQELLASDDITQLLDGVDTKTLLDLQLKLYWEAKGLQKVVELTEHALGRVEGNERSPLLYNLAAFTCPWWSDSLPVDAGSAQRVLAAAEEHLELRRSSGFEVIKVAGAHWILGCHYMYTARDFNMAVAQFHRAEELARSVEHEHSYLIASNSVEGVGCAKVLLRSEGGDEEFGRARLLYGDDEYSVSELDNFRGR